jgi:hypothetical protein
MKRMFFSVTIILTFAICVAIAGDFWASKKYSSWSDAEIKKILENSPWARQVPIKYIFKGMPGGMGPGGMGGGMPGDMGGGMPGGMGGGMPGGMGGGMPGGMGGGMPGGMGGGGDMPNMTPKAFLRWQSSLPIKQAIARAKYKDKVETSEEAAKALTREESQYILGIIGLMGQPTAFDVNKLKAASTLKIGDLPPIPAMDVLVDHQGMMTNLYVAFPRLLQGSHQISVADKNVEFMLKTPTMEIKGRFSLKDMLYQGKLEI